MRTHLTSTALFVGGVLALTGCGLLDSSQEAAPTPAPAATGGANARIIGVLDGNSVRVDRDGEEVTVHLLNLTVPDPEDEDTDRACLGQEAKEHLGRLLPVGAPVTLDYDENLGDGAVEEITVGASKTVETIVARAGVTAHNGKLINAEMARAGLGSATSADSDLYLSEVESAQGEADQRQNGIFARDIDCTLPAQLEKATGELLSAEGMGLKEPLDEAAELAEKMSGYAEGGGGEILQSIAEAQSVKTQLDTLVRTVESKRAAYTLAEELEKERAEREASESPGQDDRGEEGEDSGADGQPSETSVPTAESVNPDIRDNPGKEIPEPPETEGR